MTTPIFLLRLAKSWIVEGHLVRSDWLMKRIVSSPLKHNFKVEWATIHRRI